MPGLLDLWSAYLRHDHSTKGGAALNGAVQSGDVMFWPGVASTIPSGWAILAAAQGRFLRAASVDGDIGVTGGANTVDLSHTHSSAYGTDAAGGHVHNTSIGQADVNYYQSDSGADGAQWSHTHTGSNSGTAGAAAHTISGATGTGGNAAVDNRPPFYRGYWIYKT